MHSNMKSNDVKKQIEDLVMQRQLAEAQQDLKNFKSNASRARSITVGTAFGGVTEVSMRGDGGEFLWCIMQPVEVTELIHQLAGNIGCHIAIQPRKDFASWRDWKVTDEERLHLNGHPPFPNELLPHMQVGNNLPPPEEQPGMKKKIVRNNDEPLAIEKPVNKRKSKRTSTPS
jgi:hypothetical protein